MLGVGSGTNALTRAEPAVMMMAEPTAVARLPLKPRLAPKGPPYTVATTITAIIRTVRSGFLPPLPPPPPPCGKVMKRTTPSMGVTAQSARSTGVPFLMQTVG